MFESLASCFAAYMPSFGWPKSPRLRGFAFRCSASFNMTVMGQTAVTLQRFNGSLIDFHDKLALRIDVAAIHSVGVKRQCDLACFVDCDQTARTTQLFYGVESSLSRFLQREPPILH